MKKTFCCKNYNFSSNRNYKIVEVGHKFLRITFIILIINVLISSFVFCGSTTTSTDATKAAATTDSSHSTASSTTSAADTSHGTTNTTAVAPDSSHSTSSNVTASSDTSHSTSTTDSHATTVVEDYYNEHGICESVSEPHSSPDCWAQTNKTHTCCLVKLNGTYIDPTYINFAPPSSTSSSSHRLRFLFGREMGAAATTTDSTDHSSSASANQYEFQTCIATEKTEEKITGLVRKYNYKGTLMNSNFVCNTTYHLSYCGMSKPEKFADCNSHSSKTHHCCFVQYLDLQTCIVDVEINSHNNTNHLGVGFQCIGDYISFNLYKHWIFYSNIFIFLVFEMLF